MCLLSNVVGCREPLPPKAVVLLSRASDPPSAAHQLRSGCVGLLVQILRVAVGPGDRQTGDFDRLAPARRSGSSGSGNPDPAARPCRMTFGSSLLKWSVTTQPGAKSYRRRTLAEARHPSFAAHGAGVLARRRSIDSVASTLAELEYLPAKSRPGAAGL
jgi:hypothetical protein